LLLPPPPPPLVRDRLAKLIPSLLLFVTAVITLVSDEGDLVGDVVIISAKQRV
jgi:hypothetical protein